MAVFSILVAANAAIWSPIFASKKWMKVIFFDVGQGDAALVTFPNGENILIDAGPNLEGFDAAKFFLLPYFKRNSFDRLSSVVLSHADNDHIGGMPSIFRNIKVNHLFDTGLYHQSAVCSTYQHLVDSLNLTQHCINRPGRMDNSEDYGVFLIHPATEFWKKYRTDVNNSSLVVKIVFGKRSFLFLGDVEKEAEDVLINYADLLNADVLKIPHHGSETSSTEALLKIVQPKFAIISVGKNNKFKFPSSTVIRRLDDLNIPVIRTDENGAVVFKTDGDKLVRKR
jgi:competence protein ComEC